MCANAVASSSVETALGECGAKRSRRASVGAGTPARGAPKIGEYNARDDADAAEQQGGAKYHLARGQNEQNCCHYGEQRGEDEAVPDRPWAVPLPEDADKQPNGQKGSKQELIPDERPAPPDQACRSAQRSPPQSESTSQSCGEFLATDVHAAACGEVWQPRPLLTETSDQGGQPWIFHQTGTRSSGDNARVTSNEPAPGGRGERIRRFFRERDWELAFKRCAMVLVIVPSGLLIGEAATAAESGETWWPWALAGTIWALVATAGSLLFWLRMISRGHW